MHLIEDTRDKNRDDDEEERHGRVPSMPFEPLTEGSVLDDSEALKLKGKNSLAEEEGEQNAEDDNGSD